MAKQIEAEGGELVLRNKNGSIAIIPARHRQEVLGMLKDGCNNCLNDYISKLPKMANVAKDGTIVSKEPSKISQELKEVTIRGNKYPNGTIVTNDPNDSRLQAYKDSLSIYKESKSEITSKYNSRKMQIPEFMEWYKDDKIKPIYFTEGDANPVYKKPTQPVVYQPFVNRMQPKGLPESPELIPNKRIMPDVIYKDNRLLNAAYTAGMDITHRTDALGRWAAQINMSTVPGIRGRLSTINPKGNHTIKIKSNNKPNTK